MNFEYSKYKLTFGNVWKYINMLTYLQTNTQIQKLNRTSLAGTGQFFLIKVPIFFKRTFLLTYISGAFN